MTVFHLPLVLPQTNPGLPNVPAIDIRAGCLLQGVGVVVFCALYVPLGLFLYF